ncbi:hypothetical protein D6810_02815 [Candidatus Dojkabacteria bacterium]|uniref:Methylenetetrahydrofolate reductase n=1 Tax=Candidatus Dojkabacteria bacterium TaxID=2099670 RepID=A0A3M0Z409_9BACT|nr:MAG: hypothetical protein D6810_02815 [Candidatus Dojkabacteria bacterium]
MVHEITNKDFADFDSLINFLKSNTVKSISIANKSPEDENILKAMKIKKKLNFDVDINIVYSIRVNGVKTISLAVQKWERFLIEAIHYNQKKILVVSGNPKYPKFRSLTALNYAKKFENYGLSFGVAFNPFLNLEEEYKLLKQKLDTGIVSRIYFQLGDDFLHLKKGLHFCNKYFPNTEKFVSVLNPTSPLFNSFKRRPWNGVRFSEKFLKSSTDATKINNQIIRIANENNAEIYVTGLVSLKNYL